jgi:hypothetical protein
VVRTTVRSRRLRAPVLLLVGAVAAGCVLPAPSAGAFESKASESAASAVSDARTALLAAALAIGDRSFAPLISVQLAESATGAASTAATFASIQPPDAAADRLRAQLLPLLQRAADLIARMRIAARRGDVQALQELRGPLAPAADALERFAEAHA